jgi:hypothetical protein
MTAIGKRVAHLEDRVGELETGRERDTDFFITLTREMALLSGTMNREFTVVHRQLDLMGADVASLKVGQRTLETNQRAIVADIVGLKADVVGLKADVVGLKADVVGLKADVVGLKADITEIKSDVGSLKDDMSAVLRILTDQFGK